MPLFTEEGDRKGVLIVARDVTEKRAAEAIYLHSAKLTVAGQLAAGIAHEVRNPLTVLMGFLQLMQQTGEYKDSHVSYMIAEIQRIEAILHDFLLVAKPTLDVFTVVDFAEVVSGTVDLMRTEANLRGVEVKSAIAASLPPMSGDPNRLRQVMINLMKNAIEAVSSGTGLGMMLCQRIVQTHGGQLKIASEVGVGTTVDMWLPVIHSHGESLTLAPV